jgi:predicted dehydrogenase
VRNFSATEGACVAAICDVNEEALRRAQKNHSHVRTTLNCAELLTAADIDAVAIVTPVSMHFELAKKALENGKHIFVEKPFTASVSQAEALIELAARRRLTIMVDHTFLFTGSVKKIKSIIDDGILGDLYYYDSTRMNLGLFQHDVNVIWDLAPHDFSIMDYVIRERPVALVANGATHFHTRLENIAYVTAYFNSNMIGHFNVNWLSPVKVRTALIGGHKKMLVWNDLEADEKIKVYDKGVEVENKEGSYNIRVSYRSGDMWAPRLDYSEALKIEAQYFVDCIMNDKTPVNDGQAGLRVVRMLEATDESIKNKGKLVKL